jgi:FkbM family methyltransferase
VIARIVRWYVLWFPVARGKGIVLRRIVPLLPEQAREFEIAVGRGHVTVRWDEAIGRHIAREGSFEQAELEEALRVVARGDTVIDVGANIGMITVPLALAAHEGGLVVAFEPLPDNVRRLRANLERNTLSNVRVVEAAAGPMDGVATLHTARDAAFGSLDRVVKYRAASDIEVSLRSVDSVWRELGEPRVSLVKIDVEGTELDVLRGASALLKRDRPALLVEADPGERAAAVRQWLAGIGYRETTPSTFERDNLFFQDERSSAPS